MRVLVHCSQKSCAIKLTGTYAAICEQHSQAISSILIYISVSRNVSHSTRSSRVATRRTQVIRTPLMVLVCYKWSGALHKSSCCEKLNRNFLIQYDTMQHNTIQCTTIQYNTLQYHTISPFSYQNSADRDSDLTLVFFATDGR